MKLCVSSCPTTNASNESSDIVRSRAVENAVILPVEKALISALE